MLRLRRGFTNFYKLFPKTLKDGPPPHGSFKIDPQKLRKEYIQAQQQVHPDVAKSFTDGAPDAAVFSTAYRAMLDPLTRAEHILKLKGVDSLDESHSLTDEDFLMNVMMIREEISECEDPKQRQLLREQNEGRIKKVEDELTDAFAKDDIERAKKLTIELSYWSKLAKSLSE